MYLQVQNKFQTSFNTFKTTSKDLIKDIKARGWSVGDCKISEIRKELIETTHKSPDGKNTIGVLR